MQAITYRRPRPKRAESLFRERCRLKGDSSLPGVCRPICRPIVTENEIWISEELSIPFSTLRTVELSNNHKWVEFTYYDARLEESVFVKLAPQISILGVTIAKSRPKAEALFAILDEANNRREENEPGVEQDGSELAAQTLVCERCGDPECVPLSLGHHACLGVWPLIGIFGHEIRVYTLCASHASKAAVKETLKNLFGYLGFPGFFTAPFRALKNLHSYAEAFGRATLPIVIAFVLNIAACGFIIGLLIWNWFFND